MATTPTAVDVDAVVLAVWRDAGVTCGPNVPADLLDRLPYVTGRQVSGPGLRPLLATRATVVVDAWAGTRVVDGADWGRLDARALAVTCRNALYLAWRHQTVHAGGHIAFYEEQAGPAELRLDEQPDGLYRFNATYDLIVR